MAHLLPLGAVIAPEPLASAIYAISRDFNLMLETLAGRNEDIPEGVFAFHCRTQHPL